VLERFGIAAKMPKNHWMRSDTQCFDYWCRRDGLQYRQADMSSPDESRDYMFSDPKHKNPAAREAFIAAMARYKKIAAVLGPQTQRLMQLRQLGAPIPAQLVDCRGVFIPAAAPASTNSPRVTPR
jgi:hypothetical protein